MNYEGTTQVIVVIFLILVAIIIMNMIVGLAINNITNIFQASGILRLQMTVGLMKIIEDFIDGVDKFIPCLKNGIKILPKLRYSLFSYELLKPEVLCDATSVLIFV